MILQAVKDRVTCSEKKRVICLRPDHCHPSPTIEILTFKLDGVPVWIEQADELLYHVKIGPASELFQTQEQVMQLLEAQ